MAVGNAESRVVERRRTALHTTVRHGEHESHQVVDFRVRQLLGLFREELRLLRVRLEQRLDTDDVGADPGICDWMTTAQAARTTVVIELPLRVLAPIATTVAAASVELHYAAQGGVAAIVEVGRGQADIAERWCLEGTIDTQALLGRLEGSHFNGVCACLGCNFRNSLVEPASIERERVDLARRFGHLARIRKRLAPWIVAPNTQICSSGRNTEVVPALVIHDGHGSLV